MAQAFRKMITTSSIFNFEHKKKALLPKHLFLQRMFWNALFATLILAICLGRYYVNNKFMYSFLIFKKDNTWEIYRTI